MEGKLISVESIEICDEGPRAQHAAVSFEYDVFALNLPRLHRRF